MEGIIIKLVEIKEASEFRKIHLDALKICANDCSDEIMTVLTDEKRMTF